MHSHNFRYDINGLRAYAVLLVVLFHFNVLGFSAGFIGVDIFFVISGYLMSSIIIEKMEQRKFSFTDFYLARIQRIFPALLFLILVFTVLGWFIFIPEDLKAFSTDARYSLGFISNDLYYQQSGDYFSALSHDKPLLHTWSLAVEWQFYISFPILVYLYFKIFKNNQYLFLFLCTLFLASFSLSVYLSPKDPMYAFFQLPTRAWELIAGGLSYYYFRNVQLSSTTQRYCELSGFTLIAFSLIYFGPQTLWPSYSALLPIVGTILIILANQQKSIFTRPKFFQSIGNASYSIYLWHWPIAFLFSYFLFDQTSLNISLAIILSCILGGLSYRYIESLRRYLAPLKKQTIYILFFGILLLLIPLYKSLSEDGGSNRVTPEYLTESKKLDMPRSSNGWCFYDIKDQHDLKVGNQGLSCHIASTQPNAQSALLFGDSFAGHNIPFWHRLGQKLNLNIRTISTNWCYPSLDKEFTGTLNSTAYQQCLINRQFLKQHLDQYDILIFAGRWSDIMQKNQFDGFEKLLQVADADNKKVIIMDEPHVFEQNISLLYKRAAWLNLDFNLQNYLENDKAIEQQHTAQYLQELVQHEPNILLLTQTDLFKPDQMAEQNIPYSYDGRHLSILGSFASEQYFIQQPKYAELRQFLEQP